MKALYTAFGAFAAVALLASCGSEDVLETVQTEVPAGKHLVTLTVDKDAQSRVVMNNTSGDMTWEENDKIYVKYSNHNLLYEFVWNGYVDEDGHTDYSKATFVGAIDDVVFRENAPVKVYYNAHFTGNVYETDITDFDSYKTQDNFVADDGKFYFRDNNSGVYLSGSTNYGEGATEVEVFTATIGLEDFAMVKIPAADIQEIVEEVIDSEGKVTVTVNGVDNSGEVYSKEYPIIVKNIYDDLIFFVGDIPEHQGKRILSDFYVEIGASKFANDEFEIEAGKRYKLQALD